VVRHADSRRDAAACAAIYAPYVADSTVSFEDEPPSADEFARRIDQISTTHPWLVAVRDGVVAGFAYACPHRPRAAYRWATEVTVYVDASRRRSGIGRQLYEALFSLLRQQRLQTACAGIALPNDASVGLHEALGFEPVGIYRRIGYKHGAWHDVGWWQLELLPFASSPEEPLAPQALRTR
jgi:phosphinothricin acetyltransferase